MTRPNAKIAFGVALAIWFALVFCVAIFWPDSMLAWKMWAGTSLLCFVVFFGGYAYLTKDEAQSAVQRESLYHEVAIAEAEARKAKARAEAKHHNLQAAQSIQAMRQLGRAHNAPSRKRETEVQEWYITLLGKAKEGGQGVGFNALRQYFTGTRDERLTQWQLWIAAPFADKVWIAPVKERQPTRLLVTLENVEGHIEAGDLPKYPDTLPLPRMNWRGEQEPEKPAENQREQAYSPDTADTVYAKDVT